MRKYSLCLFFKHYLYVYFRNSSTNLYCAPPDKKHFISNRRSYAFTNNLLLHLFQYDSVDFTEIDEIRMSPIIAIRSQSGNCSENGEKLSKRIESSPALPRNCMSRSYYRENLVRRKHSSVKRRRQLNSNPREKTPKCKVPLPRINDVNSIDRYSRMVFPLLFVCFNLLYWVFYLFIKKDT